MASSSGQFYQSGYERFRRELQRDGLRVERIRGDGSCMYHSIADQLQVNQIGYNHDYQYVKGRIIQHIRENADTYKQAVENNDIERYLHHKERDGTWGGIIELKAAAKVFKVNIYVYSTTDPSWGLPLFEGQDVKTLLLSYHGNSHYDSLRKTSRGTQNLFHSNQQMPLTPEQLQKESIKKQFLDELRKEQLEIVEVVGTGNRLFHAVADQLQQVLRQKNIVHKKVRDDVYSYMKKNKKKFKSQVEDGDVDKYVRKMKDTEENGTDVELQAVAAHFQVNIKVFCTDEPTYIIKSPSKNAKWIFLSYHDNSYYNSLEKITDTPPEDVPTHQNSTAQDPQNTLASSTSENQKAKTETEVEPTNQELEEFYEEFKKELANDHDLEIVPLKMGAGYRLIYCIAHQLQQVYPKSNFDYNTVQNKIQQYINSRRSEYYNFKGDKMQGPRENEGMDDLKTAGVVFEVNVKVFYPNKNLQEIRLDGNVKKSIILGCFNGNIYYSLRKITENSSNRPGQLTETHTQHKSEHGTELQNPSVWEISRSNKPESSSNFEKNFQEFQTSKENDETMEKVVTQEGSGYFHSIADQLQNLEDRWKLIDSKAVKHQIKKHLEQKNSNYGSNIYILNYQFDKYMDSLSRREYEVEDQDLKIVSQTFEVNVVLVNYKYSKTQIWNDFQDKPATIYLSYDGTQFKSLRIKENTHDPQNKDGNSSATKMDICSPEFDSVRS